MTRRRKLLACTAVVALTLAATTAAGAKPVTLDDTALAAAALATTDFPPGWQPVPADFSASVTTPDPTGGWCGVGNTVALAEARHATGAVFVAFTPDPLLHGAVYEHLISFPTVAAAKSITRPDPACTQWTDGGWSYTLEIVPGPRLGGTTTRARVTGTSASGAVGLSEDVAIIRRGNNVIVVGEDRYDGSTASARDTEHYAAIAAQRWRTAIAAAR